jgi:cytochrome c oxidase assembly protein subunit 15
MKKSVRYWLVAGIILVLVQMILGAITRLTGSGLSITKWDIITGTFFPLTDSSWNHYFDLYKSTPQYQKINFGMTLSEFKFIFFWEYFHRLWARLMGFVFLFPFIYFLIKKYLAKKDILNLSFVIILTVFVASLGWIMVASGLINRPWVNAYKLAFHLTAALLVLLMLLKTYIDYNKRPFVVFYNISRNEKISLNILMVLVLLQFFLGGIMSGMKAALVAPTWPLINDVFIPMYSINIFRIGDFLIGEYEQNSVAPLIIQFWHRSVAYIVFLFILIFYIWNSIKIGVRNNYILKLFLIVSIQLLLGILTLFYSVGKIPILLGVLHQIGGIVLVSFVFIYFYSSHFLNDNERNVDKE